MGHLSQGTAGLTPQILLEELLGGCDSAIYTIQ